MGRPEKEIEHLMKKRQKIVVGVAAVAVGLAAGGGGIAAWQAFAESPKTPAIQELEDDLPGHPDLPEPGDHPDGPGQ